MVFFVKVVDFRYTIVESRSQLFAKIRSGRYAWDIPCLFVALRVVVGSEELRITCQVEKEIRI